MTDSEEDPFPFAVTFPSEEDDKHKADRFAGFFYAAGLETEVLINPETSTYFVWLSRGTE